MSISIRPIRDPSPNAYSVSITDEETHKEIHTIVTKTPAVVDQYISTILRIHRRRKCLLVGLDVEWRPTFTRNTYNPVATLQLCVGRRCLVFQIMHAPFIPRSLVDFLNNPNFQFLGVGIGKDEEKLLRDYGLEVRDTIDLGWLAKVKLGLSNNVGLKTLAKEVLDMEIEKPKSTTLSKWDDEFLTYSQAKYACVDAYLSFEIGRTLIDGNN